MLVIDDNAANRELYVDLLEMTPYEVLTLDSGEGAVEMVCARRPALVLLDINLPGKDGFEVARAIHAALGDEAPAIIALTASSLPGLQDRLRQAGFCALMSKPCGLATFLEGVEWGINPVPQRVFRQFSG